MNNATPHGVALFVVYVRFVTYLLWSVSCYANLILPDSRRAPALGDNPSSGVLRSYGRWHLA